MTIDERLDAARARLDRVSVERLDAEVAAGAIVVDIRPVHFRWAEGGMPGALIMESNVVLWRFAPSSDARLADLAPDPRVILFCNEGYASSLVAAELHDVGVPRATDLVGGYRAWRLASGR